MDKKTNKLNKKVFSEPNLAAQPDNLEKRIDLSVPDIFMFIEQLITAKENWIFSHSNRTQRYLELIIEDNERYYASAWVAGSLHDFGKIFVPDKILEAPRKLTEEEFEYIKEHPSKGYHIFKASELGDEMASFCLLLHHKHWNGGGYVLPKKPRIPDYVSKNEKENIIKKYNELKKYETLKGNEIPYLARVMAVADSFDAMTRPRPYRKIPLTAEQALEELRIHRKTQFDPKIVDEFLRKEVKVLKLLDYFKEKEKEINTNHSYIVN